MFRGVRRGLFRDLVPVTPFDAGDFVHGRILSGLQRRKPPADRHPQGLEFQMSMNVWERLDLRKSRLKKVLSAQAVRPRIVVERCGHLNQTL